MTSDEYLAMMIEPTKEVCGNYGLPYACCVAQGAIESSWGNDGIGNGGFNLFGRKWNGTGDYVTENTKEDDGTGNLYDIVAKFQSYATIGDAVNDWCQLMIWVKDDGTDGPYTGFSNAYKADGDLEAFVRGIAEVYATDVNYATKIMETIHACNLT